MNRRTGSVALGSLPSELTERFDLRSQVDEGGKASVFRAHDRVLGREVAVKVFEAVADGTGQRERFEREILLSSGLRHPLIVPVLAHGVADAHRFYVMPFVQGETLRSRLLREERLPLAATVQIAMDLCEALSYAHAHGVIHRDLKPENMFGVGGRTLLADFGIATMTGGSVGLRLTESGVAHGTPAYMSPEQGMARHDLDGRSDLYALGCVLWELLAGHPPFRHANMMQLVTMHVSAPLPNFAAVTATVPRALAALVHDLLAKSREDRPASAHVVHDRLRSVRSEALGALSIPLSRPTPRSVDVVTPSMMAYRQGRSVLARGIAGGPGAAEALQVARTYFERAIAMDTENQAACVGLAEAIQAMGAVRGGNPERAGRESAVLRRSVVDHAGSSAEVQVVLGETQLYWEDDVAAAGRSFAKALALDPGHPGALRLHGVWLKVMGRTEEACEHLRATLNATSPDPDLLLAFADVLCALGRELEALKALRNALRIEPRHEGVLERVARCAHRAGIPREATQARRALLQQRAHGAARLAAFEADLRSLGWHEARRADLTRDVEALMQRSAVEDPFQARGAHRQLADDLLMTLADLDCWVEAMDCVAQGALRRPARLRLVLTDLPFDRRGLASDPRYAPLLAAAGLEALL